MDKMLSVNSLDNKGFISHVHGRSPYNYSNSLLRTEISVRSYYSSVNNVMIFKAILPPHQDSSPSLAPLSHH